MAHWHNVTEFQKMEQNWQDLVDPKIVPKIAHLDLSERLTRTTEFVPGGAYGDISKGYCKHGELGEVKVAIKRLRYHMKGADIKHLFEKEIYAWQKLKHNNILHLLGFAFDHGNALLVSEWMEYGSAWKYVMDHHDANVMHLVIGISRGLAYMHEKDVIHSDLKPDNIIVSPSGEALICDFGCSRTIDASLSLAKPTSGLRGTCRYFAYELMQSDSKGHTKQTDVWAFGVTAYELLTKQQAYKGLDYLQTVLAIQQGCLPCHSSRPSTFPNINQDVGNFVMGICLFCWKQDPLQRPTMDFLTLNLDHHLLMQERLSSSLTPFSRQRLVKTDEVASHNLLESTTAIKQEKKEQANVFKKEREEYQAEITRLRLELQKSTSLIDQEHKRIEDLTQEVLYLKTQNESEVAARRNLEQLHPKLLADAEALRKGKTEALAEATCCTQAVRMLKLNLSHVRDEQEEVKKLCMAHAKRVEQLISDRAEALQSLVKVHDYTEDLHQQIVAVWSETTVAHCAPQGVSQQRKQSFHAEVLGLSHFTRDCITFANGDRTVIGQQSFEINKKVNEVAQQLTQVCRMAELFLHSDNREELQTAECELQTAHHVEQASRNNLSGVQVSLSNFEQKIADRDRLIAQILDVAIAFRDCHTKVSIALQRFSVHRTPALRNRVNSSETRFPTSLACEDTTPIDPTNPVAALEILRSYDLDSFSGVVAKVVSAVCKWQRQCREEYRERYNDKITFRDFKRGDLALFFPEHSLVSKPWVAFNVSFPNHFLDSTGCLAEQHTSQEWFVARITSISKKTVDAREPTSNPYSLGDGAKYYMLKVEDWTPPRNDSPKRTKSSGKLQVQWQE